MKGTAGLVVLGALVGVLLGVGGYTFHYAEGLSYLSTDPQACVNCHIMRPQYDVLAEGEPPRRRHAASTATCRTTSSASTSPRPRTATTTRRAFTLQDFHEPIMIKPKNAGILQDNCLRCHGDLVHELVGGANGDPARSSACTATRASGTAKRRGSADPSARTRSRSNAP